MKKKKQDWGEKKQKKIRYGFITALNALHDTVNMNKCSQQSSWVEKKVLVITH